MAPQLSFTLPKKYFLSERKAFLEESPSLRVDELVDGILVGIGDRDAGLAIKDAHVTDGVHAAEVGDERTVDALELLAGQTALQSFEVGEGRNLTALCEMETHIIIHALNVENSGEVDADKLILNLGY